MVRVTISLAGVPSSTSCSATNLAKTLPIAPASSSSGEVASGWRMSRSRLSGGDGVSE
jgi:hypothetical protein